MPELTHFQVGEFPAEEHDSIFITRSRGLLHVLDEDRLRTEE